LHAAQYTALCHEGDVPNPDLRTFLDQYERAAPSQVWRIPDAVDDEYAVTAWVEELERRGLSPVLIFEHPRGSSMPIVTNIFGSRERIAWLLGTSVVALASRWQELTRTLIPPRVVDGGPAQDEVVRGEMVDLTRLPVLKHYADDGGKYITSGMCISKDPETGIRNVSYARMQVKGPNRLGLSFHSRGHHWDYLRRYEAQGRNMPMAVSIGAHPSVLIAASTRGSIDLDELDVAGALLGEPVELIKCVSIEVEVPATSELVLEGEVLAGVREPEGPFGEYTGYSTDRSTRNVFVVSAITRRHQPIYLDVSPGFSSEHLLLGRIPKEAMVLSRLREVYPSVQHVHYPRSGTHFHCYVSMSKTLEGQPRQVGLLLLGLDAYVKLCILVDDDVDVGNETEVLWAVATRSQATRDVSIVADGLTNLLDPSSRDGKSDKLIIDATRPLDWTANRAEVPAEVQRDVAERVTSYLRSIEEDHGRRGQDAEARLDNGGGRRESVVEAAGRQRT
jgi:UbiD family decarboxylase